MNIRPTILYPVLAAAFILALTVGVRMSMSLFISPLNTHTGLGIAAISLAFAVAQLMWGITQPIAGALADKHGSGRVLSCGVALIATGTVLIPYAQSTWQLILFVGILSAGGAGAAGIGVLMAAVARRVPADKRGMASGIINAGASFGQFAIAPLAQFLSGAAGWVASITTLGIITLAALPLAWVLRGKTQLADIAAGERDLGAAINKALGDRNYQLLSAGFFVCGFHVAFIATHLPGVVAACQLPPEVGAWSLAMVGLFNIAGSFAAGWAIGRWRMKSILALLYAARAVAVVLFLLLPKTTPVMLGFAAILGFTFLATIPPTIGLVVKLHGMRYMATLFGIAMLSHQAGGFLGAWLGGRLFEATGGYDWMWYLDIVLAIGAALIHLPISEPPLKQLGPNPA